MSGLGARLRNLFLRPKEPEPKPEPELRPEPSPIPEKIGKRISRVAESILENERLTSDLDDSAAKELLDWGLTVARQIVQGTASVDDDEEAEQAMYPRLRATRRLMREVNRWIANQRRGDVEGRDQAFHSILEQASIIYGRPFTAMNDDQRAVLAGAQSEFASDPPQMIAHLRELFEHPDDIPNN
jgi:hypothetical protein